jgi:hypothetical protein
MKRDTIVAVHQTQVRGVTYVWASGCETWQDPETYQWMTRKVWSADDIIAHNRLGDDD